MDRSASCATENLKLKNVKSFEARGEHRRFMSKEEGEHMVAKDFAKFEGNEVNFSKTSRFPTMESQHQADTENRTRPDAASGSADDSGGDKGASGGTKKKKSSTNQRSIHVLDCLVSATVIGPMVIAHWRGIWVLMDFYENTFSGWACFTFGLGLHLLFAAWKHHLHRLFASDAEKKGPCGRLGRRVVRSLYTYAFSLACNCHWRGAWVLLNDTFGTQAGVIACFTLATLGDLLVLRCARNLLAPPFMVTLDSPKFVFHFPTRYKINLSSVGSKSVFLSAIEKTNNSNRSACVSST